MIGKVFNAPEAWIRENLLDEHVPPCTDNQKFYVMRYAEEIYATEEQMRSLIGRQK